jgi:hypothetical protein
MSGQAKLPFPLSSEEMKGIKEAATATAESTPAKDSSGGFRFGIDSKGPPPPKSPPGWPKMAIDEQDPPDPRRDPRG